MCAQRRLKSACVLTQSDAQPDQKLHLVHISEGTFSDVAAHIDKTGLCRGLHY